MEMVNGVVVLHLQMLWVAIGRDSLKLSHAQSHVIAQVTVYSQVAFLGPRVVSGDAAVPPQPLLLHFPSYYLPLTCPADWRPRPSQAWIIPVCFFFMMRFGDVLIF
jgi:hypothetical protein